MATRLCSECDHPKKSHKYEAGFYDDRGKEHGHCDHVGCGCREYR